MTAFITALTLTQVENGGRLLLLLPFVLLIIIVIFIAIIIAISSRAVLEVITGIIYCVCFSLVLFSEFWLLLSLNPWLPARLFHVLMNLPSRPNF